VVSLSANPDSYINALHTLVPAPLLPLAYILSLMELFMRNVDWTRSKHQVTEEIARVLHGPAFLSFSRSRQLNFHVHLQLDKNRVNHHSGRGFLTLPTPEVGRFFLEMYGSDHPRSPLVIGKKVVFFSISNKPQGRPDVVERIKIQPYIDPWVAAEQEKREAHLGGASISVNAIQFGWECRDYVFSIECEERCENRATLAFSDERREIRVSLTKETETYYIALSYSSIDNMHAQNYLGQEPSIVFSLNTPPTFETKHPNPNPQNPRYVEQRRRLSFLPIVRHEELVPYTSLALRLVCSSPSDLHKFRQLCGTAQLHRVDTHEYPVDRRDIFSSSALEQLRYHVRRLNWVVSFQIESLLRAMVVDVKEILSLMPHVYRLVIDKGKDGKTFTATVLKKFRLQASNLYWSEEEVTQSTINKCFFDTIADVEKSNTLDILKPTDGSLCDAYHVKITPTSMFLDGPFPERSNRVIRAYDLAHQESFLRVSFVDEAKLSYRFDREIDGHLFIQERVGPTLKEGLRIAGRNFRFLAYSQSALKEHSVWYENKPIKLASLI